MGTRVQIPMLEVRYGSKCRIPKAEILREKESGGSLASHSSQSLGDPVSETKVAQ